MKIAVTCDIHYDLIRSAEDFDDFERFMNSLHDEEPEVLVVAGDVVGLGWSKLAECLSLFASVGRKRFMVFGNHDYWSADKKTYLHLERISDIVEQNGFHLLDRHPSRVDHIGFAGNCGWYDYSFAEDHLPFRYSYEKKMYNGRVIWNDANYINLEKPDGDYANELVEQLEHDIIHLEGQVDSIVAITHHLAYEDMVIRKEGNDLWNFNNAFMGSRKIGAMLLGHPKVTHHICGHSHSPSTVSAGHLLYVCAQVLHRDRDPFPRILHGDNASGHLAIFDKRSDLRRRWLLNNQRRADDQERQSPQAR